jgi:ergothioneine biosynthesis protein EgtB
MFERLRGGLKWRESSGERDASMDGEQSSRKNVMQETVLAERCTGSALLERFKQVRGATVAFTAPLTAEDQMVQSCAEASPTKWHLAHTSWFFETFVLADYLPGYEGYHKDFRWLFNSYYNALGDMPEKKLRASFSRPGLDQILAYRVHVDAAVGRLLEMELDAPVEEEVLRRVVLGLEHEQQHLELIATDIKHALWTNPLHPAYVQGEAGASATADSFAALRNDNKLGYTAFAGGLTEIGISPDATDVAAFAFDNETPRHTVYLQPFQLANRLVTCEEYMEFMNDNGYSRPELWLSEGWTTMRAEGWQAPLYWRREQAGWSVYTLRGFVPVEELMETPVCHLSYFEADAFARWAGARLPTEFEWECAVASLSTLIRDGSEGERLLSWPTHGPTAGGVIVAETTNMLEQGALHPRAAQMPSGLQQMFGEVWEWTASGYTGYPGYKALPGALGEYNGKFMSSQVILRGGSCVTPATHIRATYRNFFPPGTRWQFSGLRLAKDGAA